MKILNRRTMVSGALALGAGSTVLDRFMHEATGSDGTLSEFKKLHVAKYINAVAWNADASRLAALSDFGHTITIWETQNWNVVSRFDRYSGGAAGNSFCYLPDGTLLTSAPVGKSPDPRYETLSIFALIQWDPQTGQPIRYIPDPIPPAPFSIQTTATFAASPDGAFVAGIMQGSRDGRVLIFDTKSWSLAGSILVPSTLQHPDGALCLAFSPSSEQIALGTAFGFVRVFDLATVALRLSFEAYPSGISCYAISFDSQSHAIATGRGGVSLYTQDKDLVRLWNASNGKLIANLNGGSGNVWSIAHGRNRLLAAGYDEFLKVWNTSPDMLRPVFQEGQSTYSVAFSSDGLLAAAQSNRVSIYRS